jgi:hypothetical protein
MGFADQYLSRQGEYKPLIRKQPTDKLKIIAIIPAYNESGLTDSLDSLFNTKDVEAAIEILVLVNYPDSATDDEKKLNQKIFQEARKWSELHSNENKQFHIILDPNQDSKSSGVGLSRKILMDEAVCRFNLVQEPNGIICSFDADSKVSANYFSALINHFRLNDKADACSVYFEHPLEGTEFAEEVYRGICYYELHMRYYLQGLRFSGHPNCYYTVGSSFAVKSNAYCLQGGMNKKKAGEDFYFLQKFFDIGRFSECNTTCVFPSPRPSDRVPFGTGAAIKDYLKSNNELLTFNPELFFILKSFITELSKVETLKDAEIFTLEECPSILKEFLSKYQFDEALTEIVSNSSDILNFRKRFFRWFNMFRILKFFNFAKSGFPDVSISEASSELLNQMGFENKEKDSFKLLKIYREIYRNPDIAIPR